MTDRASGAAMRRGALGVAIAAVFAAAGMAGAPALAAEDRALDLGAGERLVYTDAGLVTVEYTASAFGLTIRPEIEQIETGEVREATPIDLRRACRVVLTSVDLRALGGRPDYVFFQIVKGRVDVGLIELTKTEDVYFETRRGKCRPIDRAPEEVK